MTGSTEPESSTPFQVDSGPEIAKMLPFLLEGSPLTDIQIRWNPDWLGTGLGFAIGANNLFNVDPPACFTCGLNNMDPTTYDVPGTFFYGRVSFRM